MFQNSQLQDFRSAILFQSNGLCRNFCVWEMSDIHFRDRYKVIKVLQISPADQVSLVIDMVRCTLIRKSFQQRSNHTSVDLCSKVKLLISGIS